jgi:hypothetical protein
VEGRSGFNHSFGWHYWIRLWDTYEPLFGMSLAVEVELTGRAERKTCACYGSLLSAAEEGLSAIEHSLQVPSEVRARRGFDSLSPVLEVSQSFCFSGPAEDLMHP